jgi:hypothetical protein
MDIDVKIEENAHVGASAKGGWWCLVTGEGTFCNLTS